MAIIPPMRRLALLFVLLACSASTAGASHGISTGLYLTGNADQDSSLAFSRARAAGTTVVRLEVPWTRVAPATRPAGFEPRNPDSPGYDWAVLDEQVKRATARRLAPLLTLFQAPRWAETGPGDLSTGAVRVDPAAFADFATAAATRYDGNHGLPRVRYWQAWNEPNVNVYLAPEFDEQGAPAAALLYRKMLNAFAAAVHRVRRDNLVVSAGLSPFTVKSGETVTSGPMRFMRDLLCMSGGAHPKPVCSQRTSFDVWAHNPYTSGNATHHATNPDDVSLGDLPEMKTLLDAAYRAGHILSRSQPRFWVTEWSWDTNPPDPGGVPLALHARWTAEALYQMWKAGVDTAIWLQLRDLPYPASSFQAGLYLQGSAGLASDKPKPALAAFTFPFVAYALKGGVEFWARTPFGKRATITIERRHSGSWERVGVFRSDRFGIVQNDVQGSFGKRDVLRARTGTAHSLGFSLTQPPDRIFNPFGS